MNASELSPNDWAIIRNALRFTAEGRLIEIMTELGCNTDQGNHLRDDCRRVLAQIGGTS